MTTRKCKINVGYTVEALYLLTSASVIWLANTVSNKAIIDGCDQWVNKNNTTNMTIGEWIEDASKKEICKWAPFASDFVISSLLGQLFGMILIGKDFNIFKPSDVEFGTSGFSYYLEHFLIGSTTTNPTDDCI